MVIRLNGSVAWDESAQSISVIGVDREALVMRDGDQVALGGQGGQAASMDSAGFWIQRPAEACHAEKWLLAVEALVPTNDSSRETSGPVGAG